MKFSLRQLATLVLIVALVLGLVVSSQRIRALKAKNDELRVAAGFNLWLGAEDVYTLSQVGGHAELGSPLCGSWLLRVNRHKDYNLEISLFAPNKPMTTDTCELHEPLMAISYVPSKSRKHFMVQSTRGIGRSAFRFTADVPDQVWTNTVSDPEWPKVTVKPILYYLFMESNSDGGPNADELDEALMSTDAQTIADLCNRHNTHMVVLRLMKRDN